MGDTGKLFVTGCPRSGTTYTAALFNAAGVTATHEYSFEWTRDFRDIYGDEEWNRGDITMHSSYKIGPFVTRMQGEGHRVAHLIRPPLDMMTSLYVLSEWDDGDGQVWRDWVFNRVKVAAWFRFFVTHVPDVRWVKPGPNRVGAFWVAWNRMIAAQSPDERWLLNEGIPERALLAYGATPEAAEQALNMVPPNVRTSHRYTQHPDVRITLGDLHPHIAERIVEDAAEYGVPLSVQHDPESGALL